MRFYIDPGTGSMLFTILLGVIGAGFYFLRSWFLKIKFYFQGGKNEHNDNTIPFVIFTDDKRYWNVFKPICDEMERRQKPLTYMTSSSDDPALKESYESITCEFIGDGNKAFSKMNFLNATIVLSTTPSLDVYQWKRSKDVKWYVHMFHAAGNANMYRVFGLDYYDAILTSGKFQIDQIRELEELRGLPQKECEIVGLPYFDVMQERVKKAEVIHNDVPVVLLAPSWGQSSIFNRFGEKMIDALIETGYEIIIRPHPQSFTSEKDMIERLMKKYPDGDKVKWNRDNDNFDVLRKSDILISDFSGVIFDYALIFDKPIVYADVSLDKSQYDSFWSKKELWTISVLPSLGTKLEESAISNIKEVLDDCMNNPKFAKGREDARNDVWQYPGEGAVRTVNYLLKKYDELTKKEGEES